MCRLTGQRKIWPGASRMLIVRHMPWRFTFSSMGGGPSRASRRRSRQSRRTAPGHVTSRPAARTSTPRSLPPTWCPVTMRRRWPRAGRSFRTNWPRMPTRSMRAPCSASSPGSGSQATNGRSRIRAAETTGPGDNVFSDSTGNVWVDAQGRLHRRSCRRNGALVMRRGGLGAQFRPRDLPDFRGHGRRRARCARRARPLHLERRRPLRTGRSTSNLAVGHPIRCEQQRSTSCNRDSRRGI